MEEISNVKKQYLEKNTPYWIERTLIDSMSNDELYDFLVPLESEYTALKTEIETIYHEIIWNSKKLEEISKYFLYKVVELKVWWNRFDEIKNTLERVNTLIYSKVSHNSNTYSEKRIDIKDIPIATVIGKYTKLPWNLNRNMRCCFPSHKDKSASFRLYTNTNSFYCFGCLKWWNVLNFISEMENITTKEAYKKLLSLV